MRDVINLSYSYMILNPMINTIKPISSYINFSNL